MMAVVRRGRGEHGRIKLGGIEGHGRAIPPAPPITDPGAWARRLDSLCDHIGSSIADLSDRIVDVLTQFPWFFTPSRKG